MPQPRLPNQCGLALYCGEYQLFPTCSFCLLCSDMSVLHTCSLTTKLGNPRPRLCSCQWLLLEWPVFMFSLAGALELSQAQATHSSTYLGYIDSMRFWPTLLEAAKATVFSWQYWRDAVDLHRMLSIEHHSCDVGHSHLQFIPMPACFVPAGGAAPVFLSPWSDSKPVSPENTSEAFWSSCTWISGSSSYPHVAVFSSSLDIPTGMSALPSFEYRVVERKAT